MGWIISSIFAVVLCSIVFLVGRWLRKSGHSTLEAKDVTSQDEKYAKYKIQWGVGLMIGAAVVFGLWFGLSTLRASMHRVPAGHVGVVYQFGAIVDQTDDGLQFIAPWRDLTSASTRVQTLVFTDRPKEAPEGAHVVGPGLDAFSKETQDVFIDVTLNIRVSPRAVQSLYRTVGPDYVNKLIPARVNQLFKNETVKYSNVDIAPNREVITSNVKQALRREFAQFSIEVDALLIDNVDFSAGFKHAIEQKQIASQDALREQERVKQKKFEADQRVAEATGRAESVKIEAAAQAEANRQLNDSLTPTLIQWQAVQKLADNVEIMLVPSGNGFIFDLGAALNRSLNK